MLNRFVVAVALLSDAFIQTAVVHADDFFPKTKEKVSTQAQCQNVRAPSCTAGIRAEDGEAAAVPAPAHAAPPPPSPPTCHYQDFSRVLLGSNRPDGAQVPAEIQLEVCSPGAELAGTPIRFTPVVPAAPVVDIKGLVDQATKSMNLPSPKASLSPDASSTQYVGMPVWAWTESSGWGPRSVSVAAGGVTLTMKATPRFSVWSMGDGGTVTCLGPGTPYPATSASKPPEKSPDCGYVYSAPSTFRPGGTYPVSVTTNWRVSWSTTSGQSGSEPDLTASSRLAVHVSEIQALVTGVRS